MLIYSCDRKKIMEAKALFVQKNIGDKNNKYSIVAESGSGLSAIVAALFPDEKTAVDALGKAFQAFADGAKAYKFD